jgi:hypothetical protein
MWGRMQNFSMLHPANRTYANNSALKGSTNFRNIVTMTYYVCIFWYGLTHAWGLKTF